MFLFLLFPIIFLIGGVLYYSRQIVYPRVYDHKTTESYELENNTFDPDFFDNFKHEEFEITSRYGYQLKGKLYLQDEPNKFVLMCHGYTSNYTGMKKYSTMLLEQGYSILLYDHRNHGFSDRNFSSFGYFEKYDAQTCLDYLLDRFKCSVGVFGESMGAATALQLAAIDSRVSFCIEDCGYSNAFELFKHRSIHDHNKIVSLLTYPTNIYLKLFYRWSLNDVSVIYKINDITCPILFIHGSADDYVPYYMVHDLYKAYNGKKDILIIDNATHAMAIRTDYNTYKAKVISFLDKI